MIREMTAVDIPVALGIDRAAFEKSWSAAEFEAELDKDHSVYLISDNGYGGIWCIYETAELIRIAARKPRRGIGAAIMAALIKAAAERGCERMMLEVRKSNLPARALYERFGFKEISVRRGYYDGEDAIIMERSLDDIL